jgi:hypothetical protein
LAVKMKVAVTFDRSDSKTGINLGNQFGTPSEDTGDRDLTIVGATPGLGPQRTLTWNSMDAPTAELLLRYAYKRESIRAINMEKVLT